MHSVTSNAVSRIMSYSTSEVNTGKKWIGGQTIYRKTFIYDSLTLTNSPTLIGTIDIPISNVVNKESLMKSPELICGESQGAVYYGNDGKVYAYQNVTSGYLGWEVYYTIEYIKTN